MSASVDISKSRLFVSQHFFSGLTSEQQDIVGTHN